MIDLESIGIIPEEKKIRKFSPRAQDVRPVRKILNIFNDKFYRKENKIFAEVAFYALMPWDDNKEKKWVFLCTSLPLIHSRPIKNWIKIIQKKYPELVFEVKYLYCRDYYFKAIEGRGVFM